MFFTPERENFFKPLTSKYREQVVQCLCLLYQRLYSSNADYGSSLSREQVVEILEEALVRAPVLESEDGEEETRFKSNREQANWILKQLLEFGWLEKQVDTATMQSTYPFSRMGRLFTQPLVESDSTQIRTRHRNTRNTLNALDAFINRGEVHDLLDAFEYSERIVTDFTDVISELEERKRELVREVESQQLVEQATEQFFEFMEKRFQPDISVRLSADSVEKHRDQIHKAISKIRRKKNDSKQQIERQLRRLVPELAIPGQSVLWLILDTIERRMGNAADIMLPALRRALHSFTKRADIIIRQLSYLNSQPNNDLLQVCQHLCALPEAEYTHNMQAAAEHLATVKVQLTDPAQIKLHERRQTQQVQTAVHEEEAVDKNAQREILIQQLLDQAFSINNQNVRDYVIQALRSGKKISSRHLPVKTANDLLAMAHIVEVGAVNNLSSEHQFIVEPTGNRISTVYYRELDEFTIELSAPNNTQP
ncbi:Wadjet anti-phage system protein JetA family protein [Teredinibacter purpureus]|uniref:Wadjet anti-phage system protein JetA family protein n=1 Tax=Teredinibacter purpureus TaxID=2731756 RepID=UPI0005F85F44|nr:Wadjet anti-phage system protein JetA family protein [Teredinibacter purpureus]